MQVVRINDIHQFDELKKDWEGVYSADPHAHIFVSWMWLRCWFSLTPYRWSVLAFRVDDTSPYVAFLPLILGGLRIYKFNPIRTLYMGGRPMAAYTGFVCLPGYENEAMAVFAQYIQQQLDWDRLLLEDVLDPRLDLFLGHFSATTFEIQVIGDSPCLYIPLPDSWEQYLKEFLGAKTRRNLRRSLQQVENHNDYRMIYLQPDTVEKNIEILLSLWQQHWGPKPMARWHRTILRHFFDHHSLWLTVLWNDSAPIAALAALMDQPKKSFYAYIVGSKHTKLSPGKVMIGSSIQYAIENEFQIYDFLTGAGDYKFSFGPKKRTVANVTIGRKGLRSAAANAVINITEQLRASLVTILGKGKRIGVVKRMWFWSLARFKSIKQQVTTHL